MVINPIIPPIKTKTKGGFDAEITGIDPTDHDCLKGTVDTPAAGTVDGNWNLSGICRDQIDSLNLDPSSPDNKDVFDLAAEMSRNG